jgi:hypothetical protein
MMKVFLRLFAVLSFLNRQEAPPVKNDIINHSHPLEFYFSTLLVICQWSQQKFDILRLRCDRSRVRRLKCMLLHFNLFLARKKRLLLWLDIQLANSLRHMRRLEFWRPKTTNRRNFRAGEFLGLKKTLKCWISLGTFNCLSLECRLEKFLIVLRMWLSWANRNGHTKQSSPHLSRTTLNGIHESIERHILHV